jgi:hypothetical protein
MRPTLLSIDFDGTIVNHQFPLVGDALPGALETLKKLKEDGFVLILNTCRENDGDKIDRQYLKEAIDFCEQNGIVFDGVNETPKEYEFRPETTKNRKVYADIYIDDRNFGGFPGWDIIAKELLNDETD